jgi:hypothetical protein
MKERTLGFLAATIAPSVGGRAAVTILVATYTGTVDTGIDISGVFGTRHLRDFGWRKSLL